MLYLNQEMHSTCQILLEKYKDYLKQNNYENYNVYTVQKLRSRVESHYKNNVSIIKGQSIYNSEISIADIINTASAYK